MTLASEFTETLRIRAVKFLLSRKLVRTIEDAEDATQDAMLSAWQHRQQYAGHSKFSSWFMRIAINAALMRRRHNTRGVLGHSHSVTDAEGLAAPICDIDPFRRKRLIRAINTLSAREQRALLCTYCIGFSMTEAANREHVKFGTLKARTHRARKKLRRILTNAA